VKTETCLFAALLLMAALHTAAHSATQTVWRCGPDGSSYSSQPCSEGRALALAGARPEGDVKAAQRVAAAERRLAAQMRDERLQREREQQARGPGLAGFPRAAAASELERRHDRLAKAEKPAVAKLERSAKSANAVALAPMRQARSPEAGGTSTKVARASRQTPD